MIKHVKKQFGHSVSNMTIEGEEKKLQQELKPRVEIIRTLSVTLIPREYLLQFMEFKTITNRMTIFIKRNFLRS